MKHNIYRYTCLNVLECQVKRFLFVALNITDFVARNLKINFTANIFAD